MATTVRPMLRNTPAGLWMRANMDWLMAARQLMKSPYALLPLQAALIFKPLHGSARAAGTVEETELPRWKASDASPAEFQRWARENGPVVLEGFAKDSAACRTWTIEYLRDNYGDVELLITDPDQSVHPGPFRNFLEDILAEKKTGQYVQNTADIFNQRPELEADLPIAELKTLVGDLATHCGSQLFVGGRNTGTSYHCASNFNCFVMVHGQKEWRFVDPRYSAWMYPFMPPSGLFAFSPVPPFEPSDRFPLASRIPKLRTVLEPGDMLLNPPWWWHAVKNITPSTIAVATRWVTTLTGNRYFDMLSAMSKEARERNRLLGKGERLTDATNLAIFHLDKLGKG